MAIRLPDGSIQMKDGRTLYGNSIILAADLLEILPLITPPPLWPFMSGGGGGGGNGVVGEDGAQGLQGSQGPISPFGGPQGAQGSEGNRGNQGFQGFQAFTGFQGFQGGQGPQGNQGFQGAQGFQGNQGNQGIQGNQGNQGGQGVQGTNPGAPGPQGPGGASGGAQGNQGNQGPQGNQGIQGFQGLLGSQGFQGAGSQGFQGTQGSTAGWTVTGTTVHLTTSTDEVVVGPNTAIGKFTIIGDTIGQVTGVFRQVAAQTANVFENQNSAGAVLSDIQIDGRYDIFATAGDANPTTSLRGTALFFGPGAGGSLDVQLARKAINQLTVMNGAGSVTGDFVPNADNAGNIGTASLRWLAMSSIAYNVFAASGDTNPTSSLRSTGLLFGAGAGNALDVMLKRKSGTQLTVTDAAGTTTIDFVPNADNAGNIGTTALRWLAMSSIAYNIFSAASDANPVSRLNATGLFFGTGGGSALDVLLKRKAGTQLTVTDAAGTTTGDFVPNADAAGNIGTALLRWALVRAVTITSGDLNLESEDGLSQWTIREQPDTIHAINNKTGVTYAFVLEEEEKC